jgi:hypothetical protein
MNTSSTGWQENYHLYKATTLEGMSHSGPSNFLMCNKRCGTVGPLTLETAARLCADNTGTGGVPDSNTCWGFSYDSDAHVAVFAQAFTSDADTYITKSRFWNTLSGDVLSGYKEKDSAILDVTLTHTYQLPVSICASTCDDDPTCTSFQIDSDSCKLFEWKTAPQSTKSYIRAGMIAGVDRGDTRNP